VEQLELNPRSIEGLELEVDLEFELEQLELNIGILVGE